MATSLNEGLKRIENLDIKGEGHRRESFMLEQGDLLPPVPAPRMTNRNNPAQPVLLADARNGQSTNPAAPPQSGLEALNRENVSMIKTLTTSGIDLLGALSGRSFELQKLLFANKPEEKELIRALENVSRNTARSKQLHVNYMTSGTKADLTALLASHTDLFRDVKKMLDETKSNDAAKIRAEQLSSSVSSALDALQKKRESGNYTPQDINGLLKNVLKAEAAFFGHAASTIRTLTSGSSGGLSEITDLPFKIRAKAHLEVIATEMERFAARTGAAS